MPPDSNWNTPSVLPSTKIWKVFGLGDVELLQVEVHAVVLLDQLAGPLQDAERLEAQEVHLQQAHLLDDRAFVLGDDVVGARGLVERHEVRQRLIGDDHAGGVHRGVAGQPFELAADVDHLADQRRWYRTPA